MQNRIDPETAVVVVDVPMKAITALPQRRFLITRRRWRRRRSLKWLERKALLVRRTSLLLVMKMLVVALLAVVAVQWRPGGVASRQ